jgi:nitrite reductase/ring-hydroxylating ferredoxin subunit/uncharacterized membrane protein
MNAGLRWPRAALDKAESSTALDRVAQPAEKVVDHLINGRLHSFLHGVWLGHPLHPVLVQVPVGAWLSAGALDLVPGTGPASATLIAAGTAAAAPAAAAGAADWITLAPRQRRTALVHAGANVLATGLQAASLVARMTGHPKTGRRLSLVAIGLAGAGAYIGGHLTFRQAAGVNEAAPLVLRVSAEWTRICDLGELTSGKLTVRDLDGVPVLLTRDDSAEVTALIAVCAHHGGPLGDGTVAEVDGAECVICPWHGSAFRLSDGEVRHGPAATDQPRLQSRVRDGRVELAAL